MEYNDIDLNLVLTTLFLCLPRLVGFFHAAPFMAGGVIDGMLRTCIAVTFMPLIVPMVMPEIPAAELNAKTIEANFLVAGIVVKEYLLGFFLGYLVGLLFWAVQSSGFVMDNQRGAAIAEIVDPMSKDSTSPVGTFLFQSVVVMFFVLGGFLMMMQTLMMTYQIWPVMELVPLEIDRHLAFFFMRQLSSMFAIMILISAPMVIVAFLADFCLGMISRFAPQLDVFSLSMPIKSVSVLAILFPFYGLMTAHIADIALSLPMLIEKFGKIGVMELFNYPR